MVSEKAGARRGKRLAGSAASPQPRDILVFERTGNGFSLIGGSGRGTTWAGIVDLSDDDDSVVRRAWSTGLPVRVSDSRAQHVAGPYYTRHAIAVAVGDRHVVLIGSDRALPMTDTDVMRLAVATVDRTQGVPSDKLLADELELVHTLRALMAYRPENVRDTLRHVLTVASGALSCEIAVIRVEQEGVTVVEAVGLDAGARSIVESGARLDPLWAGPIDAMRLDQSALTPAALGNEIVSTMSLPLGSRPSVGVLSLAHAAVNPRGFTSLCQRIGRAIAEAAELLISQAAAREELFEERNRLATASRIDALTAVSNRRAWDEEVERIAATGDARGYVLTCDLDELKTINDHHGHAAGDELLRGTAAVLLASVRQTDLVARIGGDEFAVVLVNADEATVRRIRGRIRRAERRWRSADGQLGLHVSLGVASFTDGDLERARHAADQRMYADKRRRLKARRRTSTLAFSGVEKAA